MPAVALPGLVTWMLAAPASAPAADSVVAPCAALDTIRVVADPLPAPDALRDPRDEPLFVRYASPAQLMGLSHRLDLDRVRWRYAPRETRDD